MILRRRLLSILPFSALLLGNLLSFLLSRHLVHMSDYLLANLYHPQILNNGHMSRPNRYQCVTYFLFDLYYFRPNLSIIRSIVMIYWD